MTQTLDTSWVWLFAVLLLAAIGFAAYKLPTQRRIALAWLHANKRRAALVVVAALVAIVLISFLLSWILPMLTLLGLVIYCIADWLDSKAKINANRIVQNDQATYDTICNTVYATLKSSASTVGLVVPFVVADVYYSPAKINRRGVDVYQCVAVKVSPGLWTPQDLRHHELLLQTRFNSLNYQNGMPPLAVHLLDHQGHIVIQVESPFASAPPAPPPPANAAPPPSGPFADFDFLDDDDDE